MSFRVDEYCGWEDVRFPFSMNAMLQMNLRTPHPDPLPVEGRGRKSSAVRVY
jgi:hypothetical protein